MAESIRQLSKAMKRFYRRTVGTWELSEHHLQLLVAACEAHDRMTQARDRLAVDGLTITTRHGEVRSHPCAAIERDSAIRFARLLREIGLADENDAPRPPRLSGRYAD